MSKLSKFFIVLCFIVFIQPNVFVKISLLNNISIILAILCFLLLIFKTIKNNTKIEYTFFLIILWRILIFIPTVIRNGEIIKWGYQSVVFIGLYLLVVNYLKNKEAFRVLNKTLLGYVLLNLLFMIFYPKGIFPEYGIYFLGIRTRFTDYSIALLYMSIYYYNNFSNKKLKDKKFLILAMLLSILNIFSQWIATGILVFSIVVILYYILKNFKKISIIFPLGFLLIIVLTINIINGNIIDLFGWLFNMLNKDITLTGRTIIWENSLGVIKYYLPLGYGYINDGNIIPFANGFWQCHNTILQLLCESGVLGTIIYLILFYRLANPNKGCYNIRNFALQTSVVFGFLIMMISEVLYYYPIFMFVLLVMNNSKFILRGINYDKK